ncbi:UNVERIFIED_CONTAM: hypothetical protein FKN15_057416 [Acipenser sinensis]
MQDLYSGAVQPGNAVEKTLPVKGQKKRDCGEFTSDSCRSSVGSRWPSSIFLIMGVHWKHPDHCVQQAPLLIAGVFNSPYKLFPDEMEFRLRGAKPLSPKASRSRKHGTEGIVETSAPGTPFTLPQIEHLPPIPKKKQQKNNITNRINQQTIYRLAGKMKKGDKIKVGTATTVPETGEVGTATTVPETGEVGTATTVPEAGEVGTTTTVPETGEVGTATTVPETGEVGTATTVPETGEVGTATTVPETGEVGTATTVPETGEVGTATTVPETGEVGQQRLYLRLVRWGQQRLSLRLERWGSDDCT